MDQNSEGGAVSITDIVSEWIKTRPELGAHLSVTGIENGFFVDLKCSKDEKDEVAIAFVGRMIGTDREPINEWLHNLNPCSRTFFSDLEKKMRMWHNGCCRDFGCNELI